MKIAVVGLWHLGSVTAACCAQHFDVVGLDDDTMIVSGLSSGAAPLFEPGLDDLVGEGLKSGRLRFTSDVALACADADLCWITLDTPVDDNDVADVEFVLGRVRRCLPVLPADCPILISSQVPAGTCRKLSKEFPQRSFAYSPENLRLGGAIKIFTQPDRVIVGCQPAQEAKIQEVFSPFSDNIVWMSPASAEMTKHAINSFLALSITFMNELSLLCEGTGADAKEVEQGLKSESRIGPRAYLSPGGAFAGGTLARDVVSCIALGNRYGEDLSIFPAIRQSNDRHRKWSLRKLLQLFPDPCDAPVALLGLTYKPGTDTLRRSSAVELAQALHERGFAVRAYDPRVRSLPEELSFVDLAEGVAELTSGAAALVVCTEWPEFMDGQDWPEHIRRMRTPVVIDATRFLSRALQDSGSLDYFTVGSPS